MFNIYYRDIEKVDKVFASYIITALQEKKRLQLKLIKDINFAYNTCYYNIASYIKKKEEKNRLKNINSTLELIIKNECVLLAKKIKKIVLLSLVETAFIALSPLARIKLDVKHSKNKKKEKRESYIGQPTGELSNSENYIKLLRIIQRDVLNESELIAQNVMSKIEYFNGEPFNISKRIWGEAMENIELIKQIIREGINVDQAKIAPLLEKYVSGGKDKLIKDYPALKRRLKYRFPKNTTYNVYRLINNEVAKVFFNTSLLEYQNNEYVSAVKWLLSNNRTKEGGCECANYAYNDSFGLGSGVYPPHTVPERPHILCQCSIAPISSRRLKKAMEGKEKIGNTPSTTWLECQRELMQKKAEEV